MLVIFDGAPRSPSYFFNEKVYCGLGADLERTGLLSPEGRERALEVIRRFALLVSQVKIEALFTVATAAIRDAEDGPAFCEEVERTTGIKIRVLTGEEEGEYAAFGVLLGEHRAEGVVVDIGGASMELATVRPAGVGNALTTPLGPLRLHASDCAKLAKRCAARCAALSCWGRLACACQADDPQGASRT